MKVFVLTMALGLQFFSDQAQTTGTVRVYNSEGEQENGWARSFFIPATPRRVYERYKGKIQFLNDQVFQYGDQELRVEPDSTALLAIFDGGILYPGMFSGGAVQLIAGVKEMEFLRTATIRRFRMLVRFIGRANPVLYFFELTNTSATTRMPTDVFIRGAALTIFKEYTVLL